MKVVIIGGVAGGATAAARIRRLDEQAEIVVLERSGFVSYANCGLPYYIGGVIQDREELTLQTPESFWDRFRIDVRVGHEVTAIDPAAKTVTGKNLATGETFAESYDKLLLSPGAKPLKPPLPGLDSPNLFTLRTVEDTLAIRAFVEEHKPRRAVMAGGGFISLEVAENLAELGVEVTVVQRLPHLMPPLDYDMASFLHNHMRAKGVRVLLDTAVSGFSQQGQTITTLVEGGDPIPADLAILAIGVAPESTLAKEAGLALGQRGGIAVNDRMETSHPDIYADNICGGDSRYPGAQGSSVLKLFDLTVAATGLNEGTAQAAGLDYETVILSPLSHAGYYPGGTVMTMKVLYEKGSLRLLGAQIVGGDGVDKRLDVLATAMQAGLTVTALKELDLAYENLEAGLVKQFTWQQVDSLPRDGSVNLVDVRTPEEYADGHAPGFVNIPVDQLRQRLGEIDPSKPVYLICQSALRSYLACRVLEQRGYTASHLAGGYRLYGSVALDRLASQHAFPCGIELP